MNTLNSTHLPSMMNLGMGALEERDYLLVLTPKPQSINHQHFPTSEEGKSLHRCENFGELPQTLTENAQSQRECPHTLRPLPTFNPTNCIQLQR